jgi:predicted HicB family RNase H-like nuclease
MIQVKDVSDDLHRRLKARAAREGMSLSDYIQRELEQVAEPPDNT